jgi:rhamnogalacturonyl hydrolase YesR
MGFRKLNLQIDRMLMKSCLVLVAVTMVSQVLAETPVPPGGQTNTGPKPTVAVSMSAPSGASTPAQIVAIMEKVGAWQVAQPPMRQPTNDWTYGAFYAGLMALTQVSTNPAFHDAILTMGKQQGWKLARRIYDADDYCIGQTYLEMYLRDRDQEMLTPTKERMDLILANPATNSLDFSKEARSRWVWCDALFMGPPVWARMFAATHDRQYLEFMDREWKATSDKLYDPTERLYFRDSTYFEKREANGKKVFWSRGNGWVLAGLARVLEVMPLDYPQRKFYEQQFKEMAARIAGLQPADGLWRPSLLDPESYPLPETSGSGFFTFGIAWGINHGLLPRAQFEPVVCKGWNALVQSVTPEGKLEHVQPVGSDPKKFDPSHSDVYGVGAFLLAGSEMYRLAK